MSATDYTGRTQALRRFVNHDVAPGDLEEIETICRELLEAELQDTILEDDRLDGYFRKIQEAMVGAVYPDQQRPEYRTGVEKKVHEEARKLALIVTSELTSALDEQGLVSFPLDLRDPTADDIVTGIAREINGLKQEIRDHEQPLRDVLAEVDAPVRTYFTGLLKKHGLLGNGTETQQLTAAPEPQESTPAPEPPDDTGEEIPF